jgi:hypothetical protein
MRQQLGPVLSQAHARASEHRILALSEVRAQLEQHPVLRVPACDRHPFDAALSLTVLPQAVLRILPRQQQRLVPIRFADAGSRRRVEANWEAL